MTTLHTVYPQDVANKSKVVDFHCRHFTLESSSHISYQSGEVRRDLCQLDWLTGNAWTNCFRLVQSISQESQPANVLLHICWKNSNFQVIFLIFLLGPGCYQVLMRTYLKVAIEIKFSSHCFQFRKGAICDWYIIFWLINELYWTVFRLW